MKQTSVDLIFENFNLLSDKDFKTWMLHTYDYLKKLEKEQIKDAYIHSKKRFSAGIEPELLAENYYIETYKNNDNGR